MNNRGQVAIFVIVALVIVSAFILFFSLRTEPTVTPSEEFGVSSFIGQCLRPEIESASDRLLANGGFRVAQDSASYNGEAAIYLCKNINHYQSCIMQHPRYIEEARLELKSELRDKIDGCFGLLAQELERRGFTSTFGPVTYDVTLKPGTIELAIIRNITFSKEGLSQSYDHVTIISKNPFYDLLSAAHEIARQEAQFCYFENLGYSLLYRDIRILKDLKSDSTKIYTLIHQETDKKVMIAIRGCAIPAGF